NYEIGSDLEQLSETEYDYQLFKSTIEKYDPNSSYSLSYLLGFLDIDNVKLLKITIKEHYPNIYPNSTGSSNYKRVEQVSQAEVKMRKAEHMFRKKHLDGEIQKKQESSLWSQLENSSPTKCITELENKLDEKMENADIRKNTVNALDKCIEYAKIQKKEELSVAFDCSWAHIWNASQTSREFIYQKTPPAFHIVQKARVAKDNKNRLASTLNPGNFEKSSRQIEHAILIEVLNQVTDKLENANLHLEVCVDSDLDSNKMLAYIPIMTMIFADLKYLTSNIRKAIYCKNNSFQVFEDHLMWWFRGCIYSAALRAKANDPLVPNEGKICNMQVDSLICHLQNDHTSCWSDVCWIKDNSTIILKELTLSHSSQKRIDEFQKFLNTICRLPSAVSYYNKGYTYLLFTLREIYYGKPFESEDLIKIVMKTGSGKSFCYVALAILFHGLTIVISPLKSLMQSQMYDLTKLGIPCGSLQVSSQRTIEYKSKLFEEIVLGYTCLLFITLEKLLLSSKVLNLFTISTLPIPLYGESGNSDSEQASTFMDKAEQASTYRYIDEAEQMSIYMDEAKQIFFYIDEAETYIDEAGQASIYIGEAKVGELSSSQSKEKWLVQDRWCTMAHQKIGHAMDSK
ncbi:3111_t:CDS:10, partial [Gigaspora margarita]